MNLVPAAKDAARKNFSAGASPIAQDAMRKKHSATLRAAFVICYANDCRGQKSKIFDFFGPVAQLVRALPCHGRGHRFEPDLGRLKRFLTESLFLCSFYSVDSSNFREIVRIFGKSFQAS